MSNGPDASGAVDLSSAAHDILTEEQQRDLADRLTIALDRWAETNARSPTAVLYFLVSFCWGWARTRCRWNPGQLQNYSLNVFTICDSKRRG